jgi:hypothetical protein
VLEELRRLDPARPQARSTQSPLRSCPDRALLRAHGLTTYIRVAYVPLAFTPTPSSDRVPSDALVNVLRASALVQLLGPP